ncbi:MAG TPA: tetratricopeptide repeat protein [Desulfobacterales bacterium]|nr:tetratricopeptide repeat protein [Desulfobacterales bacterium]HIP40360.1 tetratricopeptide repeat protein [Desulfocapsa sulfexigens]
MNIRYTTVTTAFCCFLLLSGCVYDKKRIVVPGSTTSVNKGLETIEDVGPKNVMQPDPVTTGSGEQFVVENSAMIEQGIPVEETVLPEMQYVKDRIFEYGRKLDRWKELDNQSVVMDLDEEASEEMVRCFRDLQKVLNGYNRIHEVLLRQDFMSSDDRITSSEVMNLEQRDITFLESSCGRLLKSGDDTGEGWEKREEQADLPQIETLIERYAGSDEFEDVLQVWNQIPANQLDRVHLNTRISYGNALMALNKEQEAAKVYQEIIDLMSASDDQRTDILSLRKILADLYTASGNYGQAEKQYQEISKDYSDLAKIEDWATLQLSILERSEPGSAELKEYSLLLRNYLGFRPERDGYKLVWQSDKFLAEYPYSPVSSNVDIIKASAQNRVEQWLAAFLADVDVMAEEERFQDALLKLETLQEDILSGEKLIEIRKKSDDLTLAEAVSRETKKIEKMQIQQRQWNEALLLIDQGEFDQAIEILTNMLDSDYAVKADNKIAEVSLLAARAERRKAADLFIRFTKTTDLASKKKLLIESRRRLSDILIKYPDVGITDKVLGNIKRVEKEMNAIDPMLISQSELVGDEETRHAEDAFASPFEEKVIMNESNNDEVILEQNIE